MTCQDDDAILFPFLLAETEDRAYGGSSCRAARTGEAEHPGQMSTPGQQSGRAEAQEPEQQEGVSREGAGSSTLGFLIFLFKAPFFVLQSHYVIIKPWVMSARHAHFLSSVFHGVKGVAQKTAA